MKEQFSAGGVVLERSGVSVRVLLIKDMYGRWTWPKGHIEPGESPEEAAAREITEETGLGSVCVLDHLGEQKYRFTLEDHNISKTVSIFLVLAENGQALKAQHGEVLEVGWYDPEEALDMADYEGARDFIGKALEIYNAKYLGRA